MPDATPEPMGVLISFPKSGRTWLAVMLDGLNIPVLVTHQGAGHSKAKHFRELTAPEQRGAFKRIFMVRDPRDTAVSGFFHVSKRLGGYEGDISAFVRDPRHGLEKIVRFNLLWAEHPKREELFFPISYEELQSDAVRGLSEVVAFLGQERAAEDVTRVVAACSFENMQRDERDGKFSARFGAGLTAGDVEDVDSFKVRRGKVGGFRDALNTADIAYCDDVLAQYDYAARLAKAFER